MVAIRRRLLVVTVLIGVLLSLGAGLAVTSAAAATPRLLLDVTGDPAGWTPAPTVPVFGAQHLGAGQSVGGTVGVRNAGSGTGVLSLTISGVRGELSSQLQLSVAENASSGSAWTGSVADLERGIVLDHAMAEGAEIESTVTATVPATLGNEWAGATTSFQLNWTLSDTGLAAAVGVGKSSTAAASAMSGARPAEPAGSGRLAFTGSSTFLLGLLSVLLLGLGLIVTVAGRHRSSVRPLD